MLHDVLIYGGLTLVFLLGVVFLMVIFSLLKAAQREDDLCEELFIQWQTGANPRSRPDKTGEILLPQVSLKLDKPPIRSKLINCKS